jgi:hypothetical protein
MAKPKRTFSADVGQYSVGTAGPDQIEYDLDNLFHMLDPSTLLKDGSTGGIGQDNMSDRFTVDQSQSPVSNQGALHLLVGRIANRIRAILGLDDWKKDPPITLKAAKEHVDDATRHSGISKINNLGTPGGTVNVSAGTGITVSTNPATQTLQITATGQATPADHASAHATGGSDPIAPADIGAATAQDVADFIGAHTGNPSAHHARYTDAEAIAAVWGAAGAGSGLDADKLDGYDANPGVVKDTIPVRDKNAKVPGSITGDAATVGGYGVDAGTTKNTVPVRNVDGKLPGSITGDAATVGGKPASDFLLKAGGNPTGVINFDAVSTGRIVLPVGTDQYAT